MSASASVLQLIRSHYQGDQRGFASAALSVARRAKVHMVQRQIEELVRSGVQSLKRDSTDRPARGLTQLAPPQANGMLQPLKGTTFADLLLPVELQALFDELVDELEYREELAERGLRPRSRVILHGPPGNGKTSSAAAMASAIDVPAYGVSLPNLIDKYIGGTGQNLGELFGALSKDTLVVFDEIDAIGSVRGSTESGAAKEQNTNVNVLLTLLDRCEHGIIIATTNRLDILDPALVRRFDEAVFVPEPTAEQKASLAARLCDQYGVPVIGVTDCANFDEVTKRVLREARKHVMREIRAMEESDGNEEEEDRPDR